MSKHRVLSLKPQLRREWRGQDGQSETEQPDYSASLGDSIAPSTRIRFSVHTEVCDASRRHPAKENCPRRFAERNRRRCHPIDARQQYKARLWSRMSCGPKARCWYVYRTRVVRAIAEHGAAGLNLKVSIDFSAATGLLQFDRYARTHSSSDEQEPHPPST
jgi:hypothetical protein